VRGTSPRISTKAVMSHETKIWRGRAKGEVGDVTTLTAHALHRTSPVRETIPGRRQIKASGNDHERSFSLTYGDMRSVFSYSRVTEFLSVLNTTWTVISSRRLSKPSFHENMCRRAKNHRSLTWTCPPFPSYTRRTSCSCPIAAPILHLCHSAPLLIRPYHHHDISPHSHRDHTSQSTITRHTSPPPLPHCQNEAGCD